VPNPRHQYTLGYFGSLEKSVRGGIFCFKPFLDYLEKGIQGIPYALLIIEMLTWLSLSFILIYLLPKTFRL